MTLPDMGYVMSGGYDIALWILLVLATLTDLRWGKIFNALTFPYFFAGLVFCFFRGGLDGNGGVGEGFVAVGIAILLYFPLYFFKTLAAGDVKLLMAIAPWVGPKVVINIAAISILFGALVGITVLVRTVGLRGSAQSLKTHIKSLAPMKSHRMPFAPAFLCAFLFLKIAESYQWSLF